MKTGSGIETEVKVLGGDAAGMRARLERAGARLEKPRSFETNAVFDDEAGSLAASGRLLRLRNQGELTVKLPVDGPYKSKREITLGADGPIEELLGGLGYGVTWRYEKWREAWDLDGMWVTVDELPFVGTVVEIEGDAAGIEAALAKLGLEGAERSTESYSEVWARYLAAHAMPPGDMTFAAEAAWKAAHPS